MSNELYELCKAAFSCGCCGGSGVVQEYDEDGPYAAKCYPDCLKRIRAYDAARWAAKDTPAAKAERERAVAHEWLYGRSAPAQAATKGEEK